MEVRKPFIIQSFTDNTEKFDENRFIQVVNNMLEMGYTLDELQKMFQQAGPNIRPLKVLKRLKVLNKKLS